MGDMKEDSNDKKKGNESMLENYSMFLVPSTGQSF
jgi:hypothetical protein